MVKKQYTMFPLKNRKPIPYAFGAKTFYSTHHLGTDYTATVGTKLYAPFNGKIISQLNGHDGGLTVWFKPAHDDVIMRFMHLSKFGKKGTVKEGDIIGYTGNTGAYTKGAHLHLDISKHNVIIKDFANFKDPEKYKWELKSEAQKAPTATPESPKASIPTSEPKTYPEAPQAAKQGFEIQQDGTITTASNVSTTSNVEIIYNQTTPCQKKTLLSGSLIEQLKKFIRLFQK